MSYLENPDGDASRPTELKKDIQQTKRRVRFIECPPGRPRRAWWYHPPARVQRNSWRLEEVPL